jgi:hypothetical protein
LEEVRAGTGAGESPRNQSEVPGRKLTTFQELKALMEKVHVFAGEADEDEEVTCDHCPFLPEKVCWFPKSSIFICSGTNAFL